MKKRTNQVLLAAYVIGFSVPLGMVFWFRSLVVTLLQM